MDIEQLKTFLLVADTKSFTLAAESLNVVQSTITTRIKALEKQLGKELFKRDKRNVSLNSAGMNFLPFAQRILELSREGMKVVQWEQNFNDQLIVGTTHAIWDYVLFEAMDTFQASNPDISVRMITQHSNIIIRKMIDGLIDLGVVLYPVNHSSLELAPIIEDTFDLVATSAFGPPSTPLTPVDLRTLPYIHLDWGGTFSDWIRQIFGNHYIFHLEVDHVSLLLQFLKSKQGVGFLPHTVAERLIRQGVVRKLSFMAETPIPKRWIYLLLRKRSNNMENINKLAEYIKGIF